ncbi:eukaryotic translation initiation factor 3 subunit K, putative (EIF3K) [Plasmodium ovale wallikeri]|uniref:Eukaryotic translation initiation factor 3 subunit K n=2 Tax=Plasmodium ovale TaxID=36330 RepID=A0A1C3KS07_PLAOA|nr:eukaryotic translation initiation factor 3 subunit K, putative (EIF3K) [Plasmodium ovale wallikeri]SBT76863.1 eukaryotic translation initiation factor 3 subunit K, putative [Plasmodium ovale]
MDVRSIMEEVQAIKVYPHMMFNASKLKVLSDYVDLAFENNDYFDNEVMLTLLRLFCLYPHCYDKIVIKKILVCVLYNINTVDMNIYLSLINSNLYDDNIKSVIYIYDLIKECKFKKLWNCINSGDNGRGDNDRGDKNNYDFSFLKNYNNFIYNVRKYILNTISLSFENISLKKMSEYLNLSDFCELENMLVENKWTIKKVIYKDEEQFVCCNGNIDTTQMKKNINTYLSEDNISAYITKLNT